MKTRDNFQHIGPARYCQAFPALPEPSKPTAFSLQPTVGGLPAAFTLIELLVVMIIVVVITAVALPSFISIGRGAGMRNAVNSVSSTIALSRQWAITHREPITFVASSVGLKYNMTNIVSATNDHACFYAVNAEGPLVLVQSIMDLPLDVTFGASSVASLTFKTDGGLTAGATPLSIVLVDRNNSAISRRISINGLTGVSRVE